MCTMREEYDDGNDDHSEEFLSFPRNITFNYNIAVYISKNMAAAEPTTKNKKKAKQPLLPVPPMFLVLLGFSSAREIDRDLMA